MWRHITFRDGSNPYICKTDEEFERMKQKYGGRLSKVNGEYYIVD